MIKRWLQRWLGIDKLRADLSDARAALGFRPPPESVPEQQAEKVKRCHPALRGL